MPFNWISCSTDSTTEVLDVNCMFICNSQIRSHTATVLSNYKCNSTLFTPLHSRHIINNRHKVSALSRQLTSAHYIIALFLTLITANNKRDSFPFKIIDWSQTTLTHIYTFVWWLVMHRQKPLTDTKHNNNIESALGALSVGWYSHFTAPSFSLSPDHLWPSDCSLLPLSTLTGFECFSFFFSLMKVFLLIIPFVVAFEWHFGRVTLRLVVVGFGI